MSKKADKLQHHRKPKRLLRSIRSLFIGEIKPFPLDFTFASKPGGKRPNGRTSVCTVHGRASGGVGSSIWAVRWWESLHVFIRLVFYLLFDHILAVAQTISRIFSWWLTIVRILRLAIVRGGISLGAFGSVSANGLISFGSSTVTSNLHQET